MDTERVWAERFVKGVTVYLHALGSVIKRMENCQVFPDSVTMYQQSYAYFIWISGENDKATDEVWAMRSLQRIFHWIDELVPVKVNLERVLSDAEDRLLQIHVSIALKRIAHLQECLDEGALIAVNNNEPREEDLELVLSRIEQSS